MRVGFRAENPLERAAQAAGLVPTPVFEGFAAFMMARAIMAGASLGVFDALAERPDDAAGLARRLELDERGLDILLVALHTLGYVDHEGGRYTNAKVVERWLMPDRERNTRAWTGGFAYDMWELFGELEERLRSGAAQDIHSYEAGDPYWERYMRGLADIARLSADPVARRIPTKDPRSLLDLAGGHGEYAMALCRRHDRLTATIVELEGAARIGERIVEERGMSDRVRYLVGDLFEADLGTGHDIATAFAIVHHFEPEDNVRLLRRAREALRAGGVAAVFELERPPAGKRGDQLGALTGLLFYVSSRARTYTAKEIEGFMREAGFADVRTKRSVELPGSALVLGRAP